MSSRDTGVDICKQSPERFIFWANLLNYKSKDPKWKYKKVPIQLPWFSCCEQSEWAIKNIKLKQWINKFKYLYPVDSLHRGFYEEKYNVFQWNSKRQGLSSLLSFHYWAALRNISSLFAGQCLDKYNLTRLVAPYLLKSQYLYPLLWSLSTWSYQSLADRNYS